MSGATAPRVLWWGRSDPRYSRNAVVRDAFASLGWQVHGFRPAVSALGDVEARLRGAPAADLLWVPCFRQRDLAAAHRFARARGLPLIADPLISAWDKQVGERRKLAPDSARARRLLVWERALLAGADRVVVDTHGHRDFFAATLGVDRDALFVVPVGAEERLFTPAPLPGDATGPEALFFGSFLALQGAHVIVAAAAHLTHPQLTLTLLGRGPEHARCVALAARQPRVRFEAWIDYADLPARIHRAHLLLGVFGATAKAARVIPNKVYQALASARAVVTRASTAYPGELLESASAGLTFVAPADPVALAAAIDRHFAEPSKAAAAGREARAIYERWFSAASVRDALARMLASLGLPAAGERRQRGA